MELVNFIILADECFHYTGSIHIFLDRVVQYIVFVEYFDKMWVRFFGNVDQCSSKKAGLQIRNKSEIVLLKEQCHDP